jgi:predicted RecA/RadA family phage recombinase
MAKNYHSPGEHITFTATGAIASGQAVVIGTLLGVSLTALANGGSGEAAIEGVWELPKLPGAVITPGAALTWDVSAGQFIIAAPAAGDLLGAATAIAGAGNGVATVLAKLNPGNATVSA